LKNWTGNQIAIAILKAKSILSVFNGSDIQMFIAVPFVNGQADHLNMVLKSNGVQ
jgi:hypothetical protein